MRAPRSCCRWPCERRDPAGWPDADIINNTTTTTTTTTTINNTPINMNM